MSTEKRLPGRPRGSGKNNSPHLAQVADLMVREASLRPSTAMKRVIASRKDWGATDATLLRRRQGKWKESGSVLLAEARERARPKHPASFQQVLGSIAAWQRQVAEIVKQPGFQNMVRNVAALQSEFEKRMNQPNVQRAIEHFAAWQRQVEETVKQPGFQRMIENVEAFQRQLSRIGLVGI